MMNRKRMVALLAGVMAVLMLLTLLVGLIPTQANAVTSEKLEDLEDQISDLKEQRAEMQEQIDALRDQIDANMSEMEKLIREKMAIDQEIGLLNQQLLNINQQITVYGQLIADKQDELDEAKERLAALREQNKERIRTMEEEGVLSYWSVLFKANSFSDLLDRLNMIAEIQEADERRLEEMNQAALEVEKAQADLESEKAELEATKEEVILIQAELEVKRAAADEVLVALHAQGEAFDALMEEAEAAEADLLTQLKKAQNEYSSEKERLEEEERKRKEEEERKRQEEEEKKKGEGGGSGGSGTGDAAPSDAYWMIPCSYTYLSSPYGYRVHPVYGTYSFHSGVDLASPSGTPIKATRSGVVTAATYNTSAGYYVSISHGDGFSSSYLHMTHYIVSVGQRVEQGQIIGYVGSTGTSTGPHLHFSIYYNGQSQNPAAYMNF